MNVVATDIIDRARDVMTVKRVFGAPIHQNGLTLVPAAAREAEAVSGSPPDPSART